ncbi:MAG TPA: glutathione S-transferase family protein [Burkholderiaceae bacterium]
MTDLIFHHYQNSPFSQKIRSILGYKKLAWKSVTVPNIMPKPDVVALTGGYRRTPFLQIGADIYCDTALIADVIERIAPEPTLYPKAREGISRTLAQWADFNLFWSGIAFSFQPAGMANIFAGVTPERMQAFAADRAPFRANLPRVHPAEAAGQVREMMNRLEQMLAASDFLCDDAPSIADFSVYHSVWFMRDVAKLPGVLDATPRLAAWADRMAAFGNGQRSDISSEEALAVARAGKAEDLSNRPFVDFHKLPLGSEVTIGASDYGMDPVRGELVLADANEWALRRKDDRAGEVVVHFPRLGFQMKKVET